MADLKDVFELVHVITSLASSQGGYIFRGESECYASISSSLYRELYEIDIEHFDIMEAQRRQLEHARQFIKETEDLKVLAEIQHRGGKTNLIDFTTDLNIALFFACRFSGDSDGRVILLPQQEWPDYTITRAVQPSAMADAQKSMFVIPRNGYIDDLDVIVVPVPRELKVDILQHLKNTYGITIGTVYNDISGFIRHQKEFRDHEAEFYAGQRTLREHDFDKALAHLTIYLEHPATLWRRSQAYYLRGIAHLNMGRLSEAIEDFKSYDRRKWDGKPEPPREIRELIDSANQREEEERKSQSSSQVNEEAPHFIPRIHLDSLCPMGNLVDGIMFRILSEYGYSYVQAMTGERLVITVPSPCAAGRWWCWFNKNGYIGINAMKIVWGNQFMVTMQPKGENSKLSEVTIKCTYTSD